MKLAVRRILCLRTDRLGETLLTLPAVAALKRAVPSATVTLMVQPALCELIAASDAADQVLALAEPSRRSWWLAAAVQRWRWRRQRFDAVFVFNPKQAWHAAAWLAGIPVRVGYSRKWGGLLTTCLPDQKGLGQWHEVECNLDLVRAAGVAVDAAVGVTFELQPHRAAVDGLLQQRGIGPAQPFIAVHPWTSHPAKRWPLDRFAEVIGRLIGELHLPVVVIGGAEERGQAVAVAASHSAVVDLTGQLTLVETAALLQRARVLVSNDSGPVHLAAAVGTLTVALFGTRDAATGAQRWGPYGAGHVVISKASMAAIEVPEVVGAVQRCLAASA